MSYAEFVKDLITNLILNNLLVGNMFDHIICNVLLECDQTGERVISASHDVRQAFDSGVHAQILSCALKRGLDRSIVLPLRNLI